MMSQKAIQRIIDLLPAGLVNWGKDTLGTADKPVLLGIILVGVLAAGAVAGLWEALRRFSAKNKEVVVYRIKTDRGVLKRWWWC